jgi:hypothetical protein
MVRSRILLSISFFLLATTASSGNLDSTFVLKKILNLAYTQDVAIEMSSLLFENNNKGVFVNIEFFRSTSETRECLSDIFDQNLNLYLDSAQTWLHLRPVNVILRSQNLKWLNILDLTFENNSVTLEVEYRERIEGYTSFYRVQYRLLSTEDFSVKIISRGMDEGLKGLVKF